MGMQESFEGRRCAEICLLQFSSVLRSRQIRLFVCEIWRWYARNKRDLPWRDLKVKDETERAYRILVSEVMLQQTQVDRVKIVFNNFLKRFTKIEDLARATNRDVLIAWRGMGYNVRALRLRDAAKTIVEKFGGSFPKSMEELQCIKGIGSYTAAAIRNFAFGISTACLDTNIRRVLHRTFVGPENPDGTWKASDKELLTLAGEVLREALRQGEKFCHAERSPAGPVLRLRSSSRCSAQDDVGGTESKHVEGVNQSTHSTLAAAWHSALMDYGSLALPKVRPVQKLRKEEPGRNVGSRFIPNRIFRGKIIEELRDVRRGLGLAELGRRVCSDWNQREHGTWFQGLLRRLEQEQFLGRKRGKYALKT